MYSAADPAKGPGEPGPPLLLDNMFFGDWAPLHLSRVWMTGSPSRAGSGSGIY